jgi:hypothetical protein
VRWHDPELLGTLFGIFFSIVVCVTIWAGSRQPRGLRARVGARLADTEELSNQIHRHFGLRMANGIGRHAGALPGGRAVHLDVTQPSEGPARAVLRVATGSVPAITIVQESEETARAKRAGTRTEIEIGAAWFDRRYFLETSYPSAGEALAQGTERARVVRKFNDGFKDLVDDAFLTYGVDKLELADGELRAHFPLTKELADYANLLPLLERAARFFDRVSVRVRVLDGERHALRGAGGEARCSYCHEHVTGDEPDLVACERCRTVLHGACWSEHGRCPVLGCGGAVPERARASRTE